MPVTERRPGPFLRGGEFRGLIAYLVILAIGIPVVFRYALPRGKPAAAERPAFTDSRPLEPDTSIEFQGIVDRNLIQYRENAAYRILLERARATTFEALDKTARRDVFYGPLFNRPDLYRGVPVHLEGNLIGAFPHEKVNPELAVKGRLVEVWFNTPESGKNIFVAMIEDPPPGLKLGPNQSEPIIVDAYYFKVLGYYRNLEDKGMYAPMFVGKMKWANADLATGAPAEAAAPPKWNVPIAVLVGAVLVYVSLRLFLQVNKIVRPIHLRQSTLLAADPPAQEIAPDQLAAFLASVPDDPYDAPGRTTASRKPPHPDAAGLDIFETPA